MNLTRKRLLLLLAAWLSVGFVVGQENDPLGERLFSAAFYNVENLYDTQRSDFYDDSDFTPDGRKRWNEKRYRNKLHAVARVLDDMNVDFAGLAEVENESVVRDLAGTLKEDYCYIHRTSSDRRGIDMALLYKADRFEPCRIRQIALGTSREALHVEALWWDEPFDILVWHAPSRLNRSRHRNDSLLRLRAAADSLVALGRRVVVMGDLNADRNDAGLRNAFGDGAYSLPVDKGCAEGGSYMSDGGWILFDRIIIDAETAKIFAPIKGGVFVREYMLVGAENALPNAPEGSPKRTYAGRWYLGGASDHLPVFIFWRQ